MNYGFWKKLKTPFFALAPMAGVTDAAFRQTLVKYGRPDVFWTEFVSADGLCSSGKERLCIDLHYARNERPIVAQLFSAHPEKIRDAARLVASLKFDGIDINMGCPDRAVERQGAGAALIKNPNLAREILLAAKEGAGKIPVSVKTRIGYNKNEVDSWIPILCSTEPAAITIHGRTRKEMSKVPANWAAIGYAATVIREISGKNTCPIIIGNGDVQSMAEGRAHAKEWHIDGIMIGRGVFNNPFVFNKKLEGKEIKVKKRLEMMCDHTFRFEAMYRNQKSKAGMVKRFELMKKFFKAYASDFDYAKELRMRLMETETGDEVEKIVHTFLKNGCID